MPSDGGNVKITMKEDKTNQKKKSSKGIKALLIVIMAVAVCVLGFSAYKLISIKKSYDDTADYYSNVADLLTAPTDTSDDDADVEEPGSKGAEDTAADDTAAKDSEEGADIKDATETEQNTVGVDTADNTGTGNADNEKSSAIAAETAGADTDDDTNAGVNTGADAEDSTKAGDAETDISENAADKETAEAATEGTDSQQQSDSEDADKDAASSQSTKNFKITNIPENRNNSILDYNKIHYKSINFNFKALLKLCEDGVGYIYQDDTVVSYPILQAEDNDKYLRHLMNGEYNVAGSLFVDYAFEEGLNSRYSIIYGHNMDDGSMFGTLTKYKDEEYYKEHPEFQIFVGDRGYVYYVYAAAQVPIDSFVFNYNEMTDEEFLEFMAEAKELTDYEIDIPVKITEHSHVVLLSTCIEYPRDYNYRYVAILVRGEKLWDKANS